MKKLLFILLISLFSLKGFAQNEVHSTEKGLHVKHTVAAKENFYSVGRLYNTPAKEIAAYNNLDMENGLNIGQTIMIPLTSANFSQTTNSGTPVYYVVGQQEGLYRVSTKNNKVLMANLRKWNHLASDEISNGQRLIVGYITSPELAKASATTPKAAPVVVQQEKPKPAAPIVQQKTEAEKISKPITTPSATQTVVKNSNGGFFKSQFEQQSKTESANKDQTATASIFKTASGWQDGKYYALIDGVDPGTIVQVINPSNNKTIYAKVLGAMSGINQNKGLDVRISNAAANVLDINDTEKFIVKVNY
ncbi:MAG: LysM peptidoglycan-binding domain-containing protein [Bacteroidota bacterium]|nr:LysM peptidoglycan-binding domain-containing protein [Bacteroidota bacterium]